MHQLQNVNKYVCRDSDIMNIIDQIPGKNREGGGGIHVHPLSTFVEREDGLYKYNPPPPFPMKNDLKINQLKIFDKLIYVTLLFKMLNYNT